MFEQILVPLDGSACADAHLCRRQASCERLTAS